MQESEILIIGGGIAGTSTAYHLSKYGHAVTLLERNELATEASGLNAGGISSASSLEIFKMLQFDHGCDIEFHQSGNLKVIQTEEQDAFARQEAGEVAGRLYSHWHCFSCAIRCRSCQTRYFRKLMTNLVVHSLNIS